MAKETVIIYRCDIKGCNSSVNTQDAPGNLNYWYEFKVEIGVTTAGSTAGSDELGTHEMTLHICPHCRNLGDITIHPHHAGDLERMGYLSVYIGERELEWDPA
jgi:hypothetical protein